MYPNLNNNNTGSGPYSSPYPQQPPYNVSGAQPSQPPYGQPSSSGYQPNRSTPYSGNPGMFGGIGNPYGQSGGPHGGNPYAQGNMPPGGNPYAQGSNPYNPNANAPGSGYPPSYGGYPPSNAPYPPNPGTFPSQNAPYPPNAGAFPQQNPSYPPSSGGYPPHSTPFSSQAGGYPPQNSPYPPSGSNFGAHQPYSSYEGYPGGQPAGGFGGPAMGGNAGGFMSPDQRNQRLNQVIQQFEINPQFAARLQTLASCEIVVLCDDSGSMNTPLQGTNQTRWDELKSIINIVVDIAATMDSNGVDVYFLNRDPALNVTNMQGARHAFNSPPQGLTPLVPALRRILASKRSLSYEKKLLILIATDGAPTNERGDTDVGTLEAVLRNERSPQTYVSFLACTDDLASVSYLSNWDKNMANLDVIDDYRSERNEILRTRGPNFPFSFGDYIVKALLGSIDPWFDSLDDRA